MTQFNLETEDTDLFREELRMYRNVTRMLDAGDPVPKLSMDILLDVSELNPTQALVLRDGPTRIKVDQSTYNIVLESWDIHLLPPAPALTASSVEVPLVYKQGIALFRDLMSSVHALPTCKLAKQLVKGNNALSGLRIGCRLSQSADSRPQSQGAPQREYSLHDSLSVPSQDEGIKSNAVESLNFSPITTPSGNLVIQAQYRKHAGFGVEDKEALLSSRFLNEDFFKPSIQSKSGSAPSSQPHSFEPRPSSSFGSRYQPSPLSGTAAPPLSTTTPSSSSIKATVPQTGSGRSSFGESQDGPRTSDTPEGAFVLSRQSSASSMKGKGVPIPTKRLSSHLYRGSPSSSSPFGQGAFPQPIPSTGSGAPSSQRGQSYSSAYGPSSSLRYTALGRAGPSDEDSPQGEPSSLTSSKGVIPRYSSHRYARSTSSVGSSESMPFSGSPAFGPESLGRRSRMNSYVKERPSISTPEDSEDINSFLQLIDARPQLRMAVTSGKSPRSLASEADRRLKDLAGSLSRLPASDSVHEETVLREPAIEEEPVASLDVPRQTRPADACLPSSFPRYIQSQERRSTKVQTGFFPHSTSASPEPQPRPAHPRFLSQFAASVTRSDRSVQSSTAEPVSPSFADDEGPVGRLELSVEGDDRPSWMERRGSSDAVHRAVCTINIHRGARSKPCSRDRRAASTAAVSSRREGSMSSSSSSSAASAL